MLILKGVATSRGIVQAPLFVLCTRSCTPATRPADSPAAEAARADAAIAMAKQQLTALYREAVGAVGKEAAAIFEIHSMMLEDEDYLEAIHSALKTQALCAEDAVYRAGVQFSDMFKNMESPYMKERAADVTDITACVMNLLTGTQRDPLSGVTQPVVLAAEELLPSQTIQLDKNKIAAFVTKTGALNSHASILARSLGIPSIAALGDAFEQLKSGDLAIADGIEGLILCDPDAATQTAYAAKMQRLEDETLRLHALCGKRAVTKDDFCVALCANIGQPDEVAAALAQGAEGIGLFRSEFLYLGRNDFPSEEMQFEAYQKALTAMAPRRVVIRTLDLGADKQAACLNLPHEENPALGYRAIRICLDRAADLFVPQLRALLRASVYGNLAILFPMIISVQEIRSILSLLASVKKDLRAEHIPYREKIELGIMIETPAAVMMASELAKEVDFFSIGTNDLTQYTLAADRLNPQVSHLFDAGNPAVLRMICHTVHSAHSAGLPVCICGESAADTALVPFYIGLGVDELSMSAPSIPHVKECVRGLTRAACHPDSFSKNAMR